MAGQIRVTGLVLAVMPIGDYDRRVTILTKERGKISAFAKGARKPTSALLACSQPFVFGEFELYEGKTSYTIVSSSVGNYFSGLRGDMEAIYYGMYLCEFAAYMTKENLAAGEELRLLYQTLRATESPALDKRLVRRVFELRFLCVDGEMPEVYSCVSCGRQGLLSEGQAWFSSEAGGLCCASCEGSRPDGIRVGASTIYTLQYLVSSPLEKLYTFAVSEEVLTELSAVAESFVKKHVGQEMKSGRMLSEL